MKAKISKFSRHRIYASLLALGAGILLFRTISMILGGALDILVPWVFALLVTELLIDIACIVSSIPWIVTGNPQKAKLPLNFGAGAALLHALRVFIFLLGRIGPWINFDVRPEQRAAHAERWTWGDVYFATIMAFLGIAGVLIIWMIRRKKQPVNFH